MSNGRKNYYEPKMNHEIYMYEVITTYKLIGSFNSLTKTADYLGVPMSNVADRVCRNPKTKGPIDVNGKKVIVTRKKM